MRGKSFRIQKRDKNLPIEDLCAHESRRHEIEIHKQNIYEDRRTSDFAYIRRICSMLDACNYIFFESIILITISISSAHCVSL